MVILVRDNQTSPASALGEPGRLLAQGLEGDGFFREVFADPMQSDTTVPVPTVAAFDCGANSADQGTVKNRPGP